MSGRAVLAGPMPEAALIHAWRVTLVQVPTQCVIQTRQASRLSAATPDNFNYPAYCLDLRSFRAYENQPVDRRLLEWSKKAGRQGADVRSGNPASRDAC